MSGRTLVVVGGLPGAGKSTAVADVASVLAPRQVVVLDPDRVRLWLARRLPVGTPYRLYRPFVHVWHHVVVLAVVLGGGVGWVLGRGATPWLPRSVIVHSTATRAVRRTVLARLARACGWRTHLVVLDVDPVTARAGQVERSRVLSDQSFAAHCLRWDRWRTELMRTGPEAPADWDRVSVTRRCSAAATILAALEGDPVCEARAEYPAA